MDDRASTGRLDLQHRDWWVWALAASLGAAVLTGVLLLMLLSMA